MFGSKGYKVSLKGRSGIVYSEGKHKALIDAEMMAGSTDYVIYFDRLQSWQSPHSNEPLTAEDKARIKNNISKELEKKGLVLEWEE